MTFAARVAALEASAPRWLPTAQVPNGTLVYGPAYASLMVTDFGALPPPRVMNAKLRERYPKAGVLWLVGYCVPPVPTWDEITAPARTVQAEAPEAPQLPTGG